VRFLKGVIEKIPLPAGSVDVVISNCVINLSVDKPAVLTEIAREVAGQRASGVTRAHVRALRGTQTSIRCRMDRGSA
jgi:hypothetical protein